MSDDEVADSRRPIVTPPALVIRTGVVDEAIEIGGVVYHPHTLKIFDPHARFRMNLSAAAVGAVTFGLLDYTSEVRISTEELGTAYQINIPVVGSLAMTYGGRSVLAPTMRGVIHGPTERTSIQGWAAPTKMVGLKLDRTALESELASLIGHPPIGPIKFEDTIDLTTGMAKEWWILVQLLVRRLREADSISKHDVMAGALSQSILRGLLFAARHNYSHELLGTAASGKESMAVRQAIEFMRENASQPITAQDIASHANVGVRALQMGFQKELELTPSMYLQELRLQHVRDDLVASESGLETVAAIAAKWGFAHAGRFATTYFERFEEHPSETLKLRQPRY